MNADRRPLAWRKSSFSASSNCIAVAVDGQSIFVRDTKDEAGAVLTFTEAEWQAFLLGVQAGEFALGTMRDL